MKLPRRRARVGTGALVLLLLAAGFLWGTGRSDERVGAPASPPYLTIFLVDGLSQEVFQRELRAGRLPHVERLIREGAYVEDGVAAFPSMTGYGYYGFLTGEDAVESGVLGLRWFDRGRDEDNFRAYVGRTNVEMNRDLVATPRTLFERFPAAHSLAVNSYNTRGARRSVKMGFAFTAAKYEGAWWVADLLDAVPFSRERLSPEWAQIERRAVEVALQDLRHRPKVQWITFVSPDTYAHVHGVDGRYTALLRTIDRMVGAYREGARARGTDADRVYAFVSDHGEESVGANIDLVRVLERRGIRAWRGEATSIVPEVVPTTLEDFAHRDAVVAINGDLMNYVYLRTPTTPGASGWRVRPTYGQLRGYRTPGTTRPVDLVDLFVATEGVEHVILSGGDGGVEVHGSGGVGRITRSGSGFAYRYRGEDPLGYAGHPAASRLVDGRPHTADAWLRGTHATRYPYAVVRLARLMGRQGAGDLVVTSSPGYDLGRDYELFVGNYRGGHGGLRADQLLVPFVLAGPGVRAGTRVQAATAEDVGATLKVLLGVGTEGAPGDETAGAPLPVLGPGSPGPARARP